MLTISWLGLPWLGGGGVSVSVIDCDWLTWQSDPDMKTARTHWLTDSGVLSTDSHHTARTAHWVELLSVVSCQFLSVSVQFNDWGGSGGPDIHKSPGHLKGAVAVAAAARVVVAPLGNGPAFDADAAEPECSHQPVPSRARPRAQPEESRESEDILPLPPVHGNGNGGPRSASASGPLVTFTICGMTGCEASGKLQAFVWFFHLGRWNFKLIHCNLLSQWLDKFSSCNRITIIDHLIDSDSDSVTQLLMIFEPLIQIPSRCRRISSLREHCSCAASTTRRNSSSFNKQRRQGKETACFRWRHALQVSTSACWRSSVSQMWGGCLQKPSGSIGALWKIKGQDLEKGRSWWRSSNVRKISSNTSCQRLHTTNAPWLYLFVASQVAVACICGVFRVWHVIEQLAFDIDIIDIIWLNSSLGWVCHTYFTWALALANHSLATWPLEAWIWKEQSESGSLTLLTSQCHAHVQKSWTHLDNGVEKWCGCLKWRCHRSNAQSISRTAIAITYL